MRKLAFVIHFLFMGIIGNSSLGLGQESNIHDLLNAVSSNNQDQRSESGGEEKARSNGVDSAIVPDKRKELSYNTKSLTTIDNPPSFMERVFGGRGPANKLRRFRDELLARTSEGKDYIKLAYDVIPDSALVMIRNGEVRFRTSQALKSIVALVPSCLEKKKIDPEIGKILNKLLDDFANAEESSDYLKYEILRTKEERPIMAFISRFNGTDIGSEPSHPKTQHFTPNSEKYRPDTILVKFKSQAPSSRINRICGEIGIVAQKHFKRINVYKMGVPEGKVMEIIDKLSKYDEVQYAEPDYVLKIDKTPNDPDFGKLWGLHNTGQDGGAADADIDAPEAWGVNSGSKKILVCVIDTGVKYDHEDLSSNMWVNDREIPDNKVDDDGNGYVDDYLGWDFCNDDNDPMDDHDHGTHCSGTIGGIGNNQVGVAGVNWTATIMALKFVNSCGSGYVSDAVEAILYSTMMGAMISSNSWGAGQFSQALYDAIEDFGKSGGLFIAAAGNDGTDSDEVPFYPSGYDLPNIIAVAATDRNDKLADFSNYGVQSVDVAAPGVDIYSTVISGYDTFSGTSMATPHVAGVAALVKAHNPSWGYDLIKMVIERSADRKPSLVGKIGTEGRINAYQALKASSCPDCPADGVISNVTYFAGTTCSCTNSTSIIIGTGVTIQSGATVIFEAPTVKLESGFRAEEGAVVSIKQQ